MYFLKLLLYLILIVYAGAETIRITQHPANDTFCEGKNAMLSCVVFDNTTNNASDNTLWFRDDTPPVGISSNMINNTRNGDVVTSVLTVESVSLNDNGTGYFCVPSFPIASNVGVISVIADLPMTAPIITVSMPLSSSTSFTVSWTITDPNHNYIIIWTNLNTGVMNSSTVPENTSSYTVTGLNGIDNYNVTVDANNPCGINRSDPITVYDAPIAPMNIIIPPDDITSESFVVQWDAVKHLFDVDYTVRWYREDGSNGTATVNGLSYTVTGLTANTSYNVTVAANNTCCGVGPVSNVVMVMTNMRPPTSPPPTTATPAATPAATPMPSSIPPPGGGDSGSGSNAGAIAGGVVGGVAGVTLVIISIVVVYICCCRDKDSIDNDTQGLKSPTGTGGSHTASIKPAGNVPHQTAASGEEYAVTTRVTTTKPQQQPPTQEYAVVDKGKKHAAATQGIHYADLQDLPGSGSQPPTNQGPTSTYAMVA